MDVLNETRSAINSDKPACSANSITGTRAAPRPDARHRRPRPPATTHPLASLPMPSVDWSNQNLDTPDSPSTEDTSPSRPAEHQLPAHGFRLRWAEVPLPDLGHDR